MEIKSPLVIVTGKGGVGKSTVSAALAHKYAEEGLKTLLVEIGDESFFGPFLSLDMTYEAQQIKENLFVSLWDWQICLKEYVNHFIKMDSLSKIFFENRLMKNIINLAPGLSEIAILGKLTSGLRRAGPHFDYDRVVLDCFATGHCLALLRAPKTLGESIGFGPLGRHSQEIYDCIVDPKICQYVVVSLASEMPVVESLEFSEQLKQEFGISTKIILNSLLKPGLSCQDLRQITNKKIAGSNAHMAFGQYLSSILELQSKSKERLKSFTEECFELALYLEAKSNLHLVSELGRQL